MTHIDHLSDTDAVFAEIIDRLRALETANHLANASLSSGLLRILVGGVPVAAVGHASNRAGFLIASGGGYVRVQEWVDQQIAASVDGVQDDLNWLSAQITSLSNTLAGHDGDLDWLGQQVGALSSGLSGVDGRLTTQEAGTSWLSARSQIHDSQIGGLSGRMAAAEGGISSLAGSRDAQANAISAIINNLVAIINRVNAHQSDLESLGKPNRPPLVQG